ncbi:regulatory protein RecX [Paenibacillus polymyxa]|uniref:regulatory protein RecX n=1 Tax=Paenibacillus amylolyticus TaxID=1451 RepID=UPI00201E0EF2|nr:regulatory protein RecX [Paenibacillus amylolyticus]MCL6659333.1 recombination regulator RecX [Paenibacillus amylolyticus]UOK65712.1 recombination regulator RecX [Paenibacillus sp. OVF10]
MDQHDEDLYEEAEQDGLSQFPDNEELIITRVERTKSRQARYRITFGIHSITVLEDVMIKYRMTQGNTFMKKDLEEIIVADERQRTYSQSLRFLEHKPRTRHELSQKLRQKEFAAPLIEETLDRLEREKLVDDDLFAKEWTRQRMEGKRKGKLWIRQELRQKGIANDLIVEALEGISTDAEFETALSAGRKKWNQVKGDVKEKKNKTLPFLMRRGFSMDMVRRVVNCLIEEDEAGDPEDDEALLWD